MPSRPVHDPKAKRQQAAMGLFRQGHALEAARRFPEAIALYRRATALDPGYTAAWNNLGMCLSAAHDVEGAIAAYDRAIATDPRAPQPRMNRGNELRKLGRQAEARAAYEKAIAIKPDYAAALYMLAVTLEELQLFDEAYGYFLQAGAADASHTGAALMAFKYSLHRCDFAGVARLRPDVHRLTHANAQNAKVTGFLANAAYLHLFDPMPEAIVQAAQRRLSAMLARDARPATQAARSADPTRRLRVGYLSPNFANHPVGHVTRSLYAAHDRGQVEVHLYATAARNRTSGYHEAIAAGADRFIDLSPRPPHIAAQRIADDAIDILVDLDGHMDATQPPILACRPAPVQVYWLGHAGGLGLDFVDYLIADRVVVPPGEERLHREAVVRLPEVYHATDRHPISPTTPRRAEQGLSDGAIVFCAFNNPAKIDATILARWMAILRAVPDSQLWLSLATKYGDHRPQLRQAARDAGIAPERLVFGPRMAEKADHLARHRLADLFLDTMTVNAATTALDALWAGLPVLTCKGERWSNRMAESFLSTLGMAELICPDMDAYVARAIELARDAAARETLRAKLAVALDASPLFKTERFARHLESAYRAMWRRHVAGEKPAGFDVEASA
jgi:predicted O-linked N-acetylglucosamine transferase (SPINDLY family)